MENPFPIVWEMNGSIMEADFPDPGVPITRVALKGLTMFIQPHRCFESYLYLYERLTEYGVSILFSHCLNESTPRISVHVLERIPTKELIERVIISSPPNVMTGYIVLTLTERK